MKTIWTRSCEPGALVSSLACVPRGRAEIFRYAAHRNALLLCNPSFRETTSLKAHVRCRSDSQFSKSRPVKYVSTAPRELWVDSASTETGPYSLGGGASSTHQVGGLGNVRAEKFRGMQPVGSCASQDHDEGTSSSPSSSVEPKEIDFTSDEKLSKYLDRHYHRANRGERFLSSDERRIFSRMIYEKFYKDGAHTEVDSALLYQASLEVQWVEEWIASRAGKERWSEDEARRQVKRSLLERVDLQKPLSYIIGSQPFFGCDIKCEVPLLCPRPETEMWTHWMVYNHLARVERTTPSSDMSSPTPMIRILDVCCGTGCIGVAIAKHLTCAAVTALDILPAAVQVSQHNATRNGILPDRYSAVESDMFSCFLEEQTPGPDVKSDNPCADRPIGKVKSVYAGTYDVIVSNPPYVLPKQYADLPRTITHWESKMALVGDDYRESHQYLYFKELCVHGAKLLKARAQRHEMLRDSPNIAIEVGLQAHMVADLMERSHLWRDVEVHLDYSQQERWITANSAH